MTRGAIVPLESYRLAAYAGPIPCYICGTDNTFDAEFCTHCLAPMALAHQAGNPKPGARVQAGPRMIAAIGPSAAGKTVYLGMLMDMLSRQSEGVQVLARGAFSITLQQTTIAALAGGEFPAKTPNEPDRWNWVHCQVRRPWQKRPVEVIMPDMAGEAVLQEVEHPHTFRVVGAFLRRCMAAMVFIDAVRLAEGRVEHDYFPMKLLSYLTELDTDGKSGWGRRPVALILTKADQCEGCFENPAGYAQSHAERLWQQCRERLRCHRFFAAGVAGACALRPTRDGGRVQIPLRIEPRGIIEPFSWLLEWI